MVTKLALSPRFLQVTTCYSASFYTPVEMNVFCNKKKLFPPTGWLKDWLYSFKTSFFEFWVLNFQPLLEALALTLFKIINVSLRITNFSLHIQAIIIDTSLKLTVGGEINSNKYCVIWLIFDWYYLLNWSNFLVIG